MPDNHKKPAKDPAQRVKVTAFISVEAYDALNQIQHQHRREKRKKLHLWEVLDAAVIAYGRQQSNKGGK
jgi:hypothetical protein